MAYVTTNPPVLMIENPIATSRKLWMYVSADAKATVDNSGYFTDGYDRGMRDGDLLFLYDTGNKIWSTHVVLNTSGTTIDLADGTNIGITTNTD